MIRPLVDVIIDCLERFEWIRSSGAPECVVGLSDRVVEPPLLPVVACRRPRCPIRRLNVVAGPPCARVRDPERLQPQTPANEESVEMVVSLLRGAPPARTWA